MSLSGVFARMVALVGYWRRLLGDTWLILARRERMRQVALMGVVVITPFSLAFEPHALASTMAAGWPALVALLYSALVTSIFAHTAYYFLIGRYEANLVAALTLMTPPITFGLGSLLIDDPIGIKMLIGSAIALSGVLIIALRSRAAPVAQAEEHS